MQPSEIERVRHSGVAARQAKMTYFDNPQFHAGVPTKTQRQWHDWLEFGNAWAAGWLEEDAGSDAGMQALMRVRNW